MTRHTATLYGATLLLATATVLAGCSSSDSGTDHTVHGSSNRPVTIVTTVTSAEPSPTTATRAVPLAVSGVIVPSESDSFVTALRQAADSGAPLTVAIEVARKEAVVSATGDTKSVTFRTPAGLAVYLVKVSDHFHQECAAPAQLGFPDFRMCQTVQVTRDPAVADANLNNADRPSVGDDSFFLATVP